MKSKRLLTCLLAFALTLTMTALPASAATFPDIASHWAKSYIEEMTDAGMFKGYEDGTFKPENKLTTAGLLQWLPCRSWHFCCSICPNRNRP